MEKIRKLFQTIICYPIVVYQFLLSPLLLPRCRFYPSCSQYALDSIRYFGIVKGIWKACGRLLRCHPWCIGGYDPVLPDKENN